jgi:hypothetical protein
MFRITKNSGFQITFKNGYTISVQFGPANYCDNYDCEIGKDEVACGRKGSKNAECAVFTADGTFIKNPISGDDNVSSYSTPEEVLSLMNWVAGL